MITLQYVRESEIGFECRLWDFDNDIVLDRKTLGALKVIAKKLIDEIDQPGRTIADYKQQIARLDELFANPGLPVESRPFLTPREFTAFVSGLEDRDVSVITVDGDRHVGRLHAMAVDGVQVEEFLTGNTIELDSSEVRDIVSVPETASYEQARGRCPIHFAPENTDVPVSHLFCTCVPRALLATA